MNISGNKNPLPGKPPAQPKANIGNLLERLKRQRKNAESQQEQLQRTEKRAIRYYNLAKEEKRIYDANEKRLEEEVAMLQSELGEEVKQLKKTTQKLAHEVEKVAAQPIVTPGKYHWHFLTRLRDFISSLIKNVNQSNEWLSQWSQYCKKKGHFWKTFGAKKKGGSKFLLSSEHYLTRSAG
jgi:lysyl-tRNA synthetase class I